MAAAADPMARSKREVAQRMEGLINHCVELTSGVHKEAGCKYIMMTAQNFTRVDRNIVETMRLLKSTAAPLQELEAHYETLAGLDMLAARADAAAAAAAQSVGGGRAAAAESVPLPGRAPAYGAGRGGTGVGGRVGTSSSDERLEVAIERTAKLQHLSERAEQAQAEKQQAEARLAQLEAQMSQQEREEIEKCAPASTPAPLFLLSFAAAAAP
jgi:hypothetical protein